MSDPCLVVFHKIPIKPILRFTDCVSFVIRVVKISTLSFMQLSTPFYSFKRMILRKEDPYVSDFRYISVVVNTV